MPGWLQDWWAVIAFVATVALIPFARWVWTVRRRELVTKDELAAQFRQSAEERRREFEELKADIARGLRPAIDEQGARLTDLERRQDLVENAIQNLPDKDRMHGMELALKGLQGEIGVLSERIKPVAAIGERLQEFLLEQGKTR